MKKQDFYRFLFFPLTAACFGLGNAGWVVAAEASWPCFHGQNRDNLSTETGLLKAWPEGGPELLWTASGLGAGYSSVSISDGRIYTAGMINKQTYVFALGLDGKLLWQALNGESWEATARHAIGYTGSRSTPTFDEGKLYHFSERGWLASLDAATGKTLWHLDLFKTFEAKVPKYGIAESVLIDGDHIICSPAGEKGFIVCLDKATGKTVWAASGIPGEAGYASPVIAEFEGIPQILQLSSSHLFAVHRETGALLWTVPLENSRKNNCTDALFHDGHVFASSGYGKGSLLVKLSAANGGIQPETAWEIKEMDNHHGGVVRIGDFLYGAGHTSRGWFCIEWITGDQKWNEQGKGSLTYADGMLYCLDERGKMSLVKATPEAHRVAGSFQVPSGGSGLHWAHPVVCGGRLYVRHADKLFCYDIAEKRTGSGHLF